MYVRVRTKEGCSVRNVTLGLEIFWDISLGNDPHSLPPSYAFIEGVETLQIYLMEMLSNYIAIACLVWYFLVLAVCAIGVLQMY